MIISLNVVPFKYFFDFSTSVWFSRATCSGDFSEKSLHTVLKSQIGGGSDGPPSGLEGAEEAFRALAVGACLSSGGTGSPGTL